MRGAFNQPARMIDYSTMIESHWLFASSRDWFFDNDWVTLIIHSSSQSSAINQLAWMIIRQWLFNRVKSTSSRNWVFDNDWVTLIIRQLAWLIIRQWLSHIDYSWLINQLIKLIIHSSSQSSSINQLAWLIIRVIDHSTSSPSGSINQLAWVIIRQWLFNRV